jgi:N-acetylmuramoyl-L-alanine amidase
MSSRLRCVWMISMALLLAGGMLPAQPILFSYPVGTVIIDPGHGGRDPGAVGTYTDEQGQIHEVYEKDVTLAIAEVAAEAVRVCYPDIDVVLTRADDTYLSLGDRTSLANSIPYREDHSKVFISVHANASSVQSASGFEIWRLESDHVKDFYTAVLRESGLVHINERLNTELNEELDHMNGTLAEHMVSALEISLPETVRNRGIKESQFYVLKYAHMPAVLVETGFMSHEQELAQLVTPLYQEQLGYALASGIAAHIEALR